MKIHLLNTAYGLFPCTDTDHQAKLQLKVGQVYAVSIKKLRNYEFHKKYFALINTAWAYLNEKQTAFFKENITLFRKTIEIAAGHCEQVYSIQRKEWVEIPKSIAFEKMDEAEFQALYEQVLHVLFSSVFKEITEDEFNRVLAHF